MLKIRYTKQFKKDFKRVKSQGLAEKDIKELNAIIKILAAQEPLNEKYKDHPLKGDYIGTRELHLKPDLLLVYKIKERELMLLLIRLGSHSELF